MLFDGYDLTFDIRHIETGRDAGGGLVSMHNTEEKVKHMYTKEMHDKVKHTLNCLSDQNRIGSIC